MFSLPPLQSFMYFSNGKIQLKDTPAARKYFRKNSERAFAGRLRLAHPNPRGRESLGMHLVLGKGRRRKRGFSGQPPHVGNPGWHEAGKGWLDEVRKRRFSAQPRQRESLGCVGSSGVVFQSCGPDCIPRGAQSTGPGDRCRSQPRGCWCSSAEEMGWLWDGAGQASPSPRALPAWHRSLQQPWEALPAPGSQEGRLGWASCSPRWDKLGLNY